MIEPIDWYEGQKEKYAPIIRQFERELAFYIGSDLSEFKILLPNFRTYLNSSDFKDKFNALLRDFRVSVEKSKLSDGQTDKNVATSEVKKASKPMTADDFSDFVTGFLNNVAAHEITIPNIALVEILYSLANTNNIRLKRQQALYKQIFVRLQSEEIKKVLDSDMFVCNIINIIFAFGDLVMVLVKSDFDETDLQYPLLLSLALSHTSPRHVKVFLDKQPSQYKGDFSKILETAILEYDDLLLSSQIKEAYQWLNAYKPIVECDAVVEDVIEDAETVGFETLETKEDVKQEESVEIKPHLNFHSATVTTILDTLKPYFVETEHPLLDKLLHGKTIEGKLYFRGQGSTITAFFRDLFKNKVNNAGVAKIVKWLCFYINADNRDRGANQPINEGTATDYFKKDTIPHIEIDISAILLKINQINTP
jgi:hypothetical protein